MKFQLSVFSIFCIPHFTRRSAVVASSDKECEVGKPGDTLASGSAKSTAVVLYNEEHRPLAEFHKEQKNFTFAGRKIVINQHWQEHGVAAVVWESANGLCKYLEGQREKIYGKTILELGAGTGLVGIVAALLGGDVTLTDRVSVLPQLRENVEQNLKGCKWCKTKVSELDWMKNGEEKQYDLILGADIVYIEETFPYLRNTILRHCSANTEILLACRIRYPKDASFIDSLNDDFLVKKLEDNGDVIIFQAFRKSPNS